MEPMNLSELTKKRAQLWKERDELLSKEYEGTRLQEIQKELEMIDFAAKCIFRTWETDK